VNGLPRNATATSHRLLGVAQRLADSCPVSLGDEIAVTGSIPLGLADQDSDVELNLWTAELPSVEARAEWIQSIGGSNAIVYPNSWGDSTIEADFDFEGVWIEATWMTRRALDERLAAILAGEILSHRLLMMAWIVEKALPLRTNGAFSEWKRQLAAYPESLVPLIVEDNTRVWQLTHAMAGRWTYCRRGQALALTERLTWDTYNILCVLFAINRRWEPDWKWLREVTDDLPVQPARLAERIGEMFLLPDAEQRVATAFALISDTLALAPQTPQVLRARAAIEWCQRQGSAGERK
jgi:hypothetical protein